MNKINNKIQKYWSSEYFVYKEKVFLDCLKCVNQKNI